MANEWAWVRYIEGKYGPVLNRRRCRIELQGLLATQSEIERIKYHLVRYEAFREGEPIMAYTGRMGKLFVVDGHTRARVHCDTGQETIDAVLFTSPDMAVDAELHRVAADAGGGTPRRISEVPVIDRVGEGTEAWHKLRAELLAAWHAELDAADEDEEG